MQLCDIGCNLTHKSFRGDVGDVIARAKEAGVARMIVTGLNQQVSFRARELAAEHEGLWSTAGVHPHNAAGTGPETFASLARLCKLDEVVSVGECGLDYNRNFSPPEAQRRCFAAQLELAERSDMPLFLHERDAHNDFAAMLRDANVPRMVVHCFTGTVAEAETYVALGAHIGVTGWICDERRGSALRKAVKAIPLDRLMIETDSPFLTPRDLRGASRRNEPANLPHVARRVAKEKGLDADELIAAAWSNTSRFFGLP